MTALTIALLLLTQEPPAPPPAELAPVRSSGVLIDFGAAEAGVRAGIVGFSSDFDSPAQFAGGLLLRAPSPWLSRALQGLDDDTLCVFVDLTASRINRDAPDSTKDIYFASTGLDLTIVRDDSWKMGAQAGLQYGSFGGLNGIRSGFGFVAGLNAGLRLSEGLWLTGTSEVGFGRGGDRLYFAQLGLQVGF